MKKRYALLLMLLALAFAACIRSPRSSSGFRLPDGDAERGKALFVQFQCHDCHTVAGLGAEMPPPSFPIPVLLGGELPYQRTDGDLVTEIINPSHKVTRRYPRKQIVMDGHSRMRNYNDNLTVSQLADLVAFLQTRYKVVVPPSWNN